MTVFTPLLQKAVAEVVDEELSQQLTNASFYSLLIDESTDIATARTLIIYIRYVHEGEVMNRFFELTELPGATADNIVDTVLQILAQKKLSTDRMFGMATDGASVMVGTRAGVTTQLKKMNPFMLSTHCIAHRLALASGQAADSVPYLKQYQQYVNTIYKYYHYSPKHSTTLQNMQVILQSAEKKFHQVFHTRWLSLDRAVQAILDNLDPLISALISDSDNDPTAKGILKFITTFQFLATTHFLADALPVLSQLSKRFQRQCVDFTAVSEGVQVTISALEGFKQTPGPRLQKFTSEIPSEPGEEFYFKEHRISDSHAQRQGFVASSERFIHKLKENLQSRFPDSGMLSAFSIFDPLRLPSTEINLPMYGVNDLDTLCSHYGLPKTSESGQELSPVVEPSDTKDEWVTFKQVMSNNFRTCTLQSMAQKLLPSAEMREQYPNLLTLITLAITMPVSTADCERGFSKHNLIKTRIRARLKTENVGMLMKMSVDTPELSKMEQFDFARAFQIWCSVKDRLICRN